MVRSHLLRLGIKVRRQEIHDSIHHIDHERTVARQSRVVKRRVYSTLYRRLNDAGISTDDYTSLPSHELDNTIEKIKADFPNDGEVMIRSHLLRLGIKVR